MKTSKNLSFFLFIFGSVIGSILLFETGMAISEDKSIQSQQLNQQAPGSSKFGHNTKIRLAGGEFDPLIETIPDEMKEMQSIQAYPHGQEGYYIVQFDGPIEKGCKDELESMGAT